MVPGLPRSSSLFDLFVSDGVSKSFDNSGKPVGVAGTLLGKGFADADTLPILQKKFRVVLRSNPNEKKV